MLVLHIMASGARGGGADHLLGVLPELAEREVRCVAAVGPAGPTLASLTTAGIATRSLRLMHSRLDPSAPLRLARVVRQVAPDIVHYHGTRAAYFGALARPWLPKGLKTVYTVHGMAYRQEVPPWRRALLLGAEAVACRGADRVVSVSRTDLEDLERRGFVRPRRGAHVPNAVAAARFHGIDGRAARARMGIGRTAFVVGTVSRLVPQKAVADLIDAVGETDGCELVIVGDGPLRPTLEARARPLGSRIHFLGSRSDIPELLASFDLFVLSSRWEGEPIALLEALAASCPVIATETEGAREILGPTQAGVLTEVGDVSALASAIETLRADPSRREALAARGRRAIRGRTHGRTADRLVQLYRDLLDPPPA